MRPLEVLFIDKGGVLVAPDGLGPQWRRLLGEFLPPRLGATAEQWQEANRHALTRQLERFRSRPAGRGSGVKEWFHDDGAQWLRDMCARVGVECPDDASELAERAMRYVRRRLDLGTPEAPAIIRALRARGLTLHLASGDESAHLADYLEDHGVRDCFERLYGADLVDTHKNSSDFYRAILDDSGADPARAAVVDDSARCLDWARECGLGTFHFSPTGETSGPHTLVHSWTQLLAALSA